MVSRETDQAGAPFGFDAGRLDAFLQAATQLQDQTLAFVPKLVIVMGVLAAMGPVLGASLVRFTQALFLAIPAVR